jgi:uncharacterized protein
LAFDELSLSLSPNSALISSARAFFASDLFLVGTGKSIVPLSKEVRDFLRKNGLQIEVLSTVRG